MNPMAISCHQVPIPGKAHQKMTWQPSIGDKGGKVGIILPCESPRPDVNVKVQHASQFTRTRTSLVPNFPFLNPVLPMGFLGVEWKVAGL